jgi:uncharacterized cupredoxin-like copper-binding protein
MRAVFTGMFLALSFQTAAFAQHSHSHASGHSQAKGAEKPFGTAGDPRTAKRTVRVEMGDNMRFTPAEIKVARGEVVRFVAANKGQVLHEMVLGTLEDLKKHAEAMKKDPGMAHDEANMLHVAPGKTGELGWQFTRAGTFYYACLVPGHFEAGMVGKIVVAH